tara:strand:- start:1738 stop:3420 length:1683 start_codon:yes stop_codon:yes gene_type:complete
MLEQLIIHFGHIVKYLLFYFFIYLNGRAFGILLNRFIEKKTKVPEVKFLDTTKTIIYPLLGISLIGNLLVILNFFFALKSPIVFIVLILFPLINLVDLKLTNFDINFYKIFSYVLIPSIFLFFVYNASWHYDAGFYHLNNQNWLRESNLIIGFVNIFWAFGMSSIYEFLSAILWNGNNFQFLAYLNIFFIHFFYQLITENIIKNKESLYRNSSILILIFSLLDNFGLDGGRNGFIYFQGLPKQDMSVAIIFFFVTRFIFVSIIKKNITKIDLSILSFLILFLVQIKLNAVPIFILYLIFLILVLKDKILAFHEILKSSSLALFFGFIWILKYYLTTGCFIFPVNATCKNNFSWYLYESTKSYEEITREASYTITKFDNNFFEWFSVFYSFQINKVVLLNFLFSLFFIFVFSLLFTNKLRIDKTVFLLFSFFVILNLIYLIFYGPTPRYSVGILITIVGFIGFFINKIKFEIKNIIIYFLIFVSATLLIRFNSYQAFLNNETTQLFDSREIAVYIKSNNDFVRPDIGDQCWINLKCTMSNDLISINDNGFFKIVSRQFIDD